MARAAGIFFQDFEDFHASSRKRLFSVKENLGPGHASIAFKTCKPFSYRISYLDKVGLGLLRNNKTLLLQPKTYIVNGGIFFKIYAFF